MAIAGRVMPIPKGDYSAHTVYDVLDIVSHNGKPWICKKPKTLGVEPSKSNSINWMMLMDVDITNADTLDGKNSDYFTSKEELAEAFKTHQFIFRVDGWEGDAAPYSQSVSLPQIKSTDEPLAFFVDDGANKEESDSKKKAYGFITFFESADGLITATCKYEKPTVDFTVGFKGVFGQNG